MGRAPLNLTRALIIVAASAQVAANRGLFTLNPQSRTVIFVLPFIAAAFACWQRYRRATRDRGAWLMLATGLASWTIGAIHMGFVLRYAGGTPSVSDGFWLAFYLCTYIAIALFVKAYLDEFLPSTWLDGAIGGFGAAALVTALLLAPALSSVDGPPAAVATNLAYPVADLLLVALLIFMSHTLRGHGSSWWMLAGGLLLFFVSDVRHLYIASTGTAQPHGNPFSLGWTAGVALMGLAATIPEPVTAPRPSSIKRYWIPGIFATSTISLLLYGQRHELASSVIIFSVVTLGLCAIRIFLTTREVRALAGSREEARTDHLTGLPNRRHLVERLSAHVEHLDVPTALLVIDLDRFKEVNDSLGHTAGDELLRQVGARLSGEMPMAGLLTRLGGDEFAVVLPGHDASRASEVAKRLRAALWEPFRVADLPITAQASIGVAAVPEHGKTAHDLMANADIAMYQAKRSEIGVATYQVQQDNPSRDRLELLNDLRDALAEGQFVLYYQPQWDISSDEVYGVEALVRWQHPRRGLLQPGEFLPLVIETRLMSALTRVVIRRAMEDRRHLRDLGLNLRMSVNISAHDLGEPSLPDLIEEMIEADDVGPGQLTLEITEDAMMGDRARTQAVLRRVRELGALISVDDYGTGRASLSYLRDLPLDEIKLDRRFLAGAPADTHNAAIVRSMIELANALELPLVIEGVETESTLEWLSSLGCNAAQGYHLGRPMPRSALEQWLGVPSVPASRPHLSHHRGSRISTSSLPGQTSRA